MSRPTAEWDRVGNSFYRKIQLYSSLIDLDVDLDDYHVVGAPYGGALALYRNEDKIISYRGEAPKSTIYIYSGAGKLIKQINLDKSVIKGLGWTEDEVLVVVSQDGEARCYWNLSDEPTPFTLGHGAEDVGVVSCRFWLSGFVALLGNNRIVSVNSYHEPRPNLLATPPSDPIISWTVIPPTYTLSRSVEVLLAIGQTINVIDETDSEDRLLQNGPFRHICNSPNGKYIALYTDDSRVWVVSGDFQDKLSEYSTGVKTPPLDMQWCGNDAVVLAWEDEVHLVGPNGVAIKYEYDSKLQLIPDIDGVRILTGDVCEFLQKVPGDYARILQFCDVITRDLDISEEVFKLGSTSSSSVLLDAVEQLESRSPRADENIQLIKPNLVSAIEGCISAAGQEFDPNWQKKLMKAASFGKTVLEHYDSDEFVSMAETLRVLNAVRFYGIGLPLSYDQYYRLGPERLIQRLVNRREFLLAIKISEYLHLPKSRVFVNWASQLVRVSEDNEDSICKRVVRRLKDQPGISFEEIARAANEEGKIRLATELLNHEVRAGKQVPLLLNMEEDTIALDKAVESGDTDLVLFVLLQMRENEKMPLATFFRTINSRPLATALVESTAFEKDWELLKDLYYQDDRRLDGSNLLLMDALTQNDPQARLNKLKAATKLLQDTKETTFQARSLEEMQRLYRFQESLDSEQLSGPADGEGRRAHTGESLNQTVFRLIETGQSKMVQKILSEFKIGERTYWWIRLRALVARRDFRQLEEIAGKNKKSPIGWEPFFNEILGAGNAKTASVFVAKCTTLTPQERYEMFLKCGMVVKAGEEALKAKDLKLLQELRGKASAGEATEIERLISMANKGR